MISAFLVIGGLALLLAGGELLVRGVVGLAGRLRLPPMLVGGVVAGFGTSTPELVVSVDATLSGAPDIAMGNVLGSNIANILLILGLAAALSTIARPDGAMRDGAVTLAASVLLAGLCTLGEVTAWQGAAMLALLVAIVTWQYWRDRRSTRMALANGLPEPAHEIVPARPWVIAAVLAAAFPALIVGANLLVDGATSLARGVGLSEAVIGLTVVAVGTSLPELATSTVAAARGHAAVAYGNVVGSNLFNALGIVGAASLAGPLSVAPIMAKVDAPIMIGATVLMLGFVGWGRGIGRPAGLLFLALFIGYTIARIALEAS